MEQNLSRVPQSPASEPQRSPRPQGGMRNDRPRPAHSQSRGPGGPRTGGGRGRSPMSSGPKTNTVASMEPKFMRQIKQTSGPVEYFTAPIAGSLDAQRGLPVKNIGDIISPIILKSNSPETFPAGAEVRVIPMGGLNEVGLNMTAIEYKDDIIVIDTGFGFGGGEKYPGIDYVLPDTEYLEQNRHKIRGVIFTHGHLDHIGGAPYILPRLGNVPVFGTPFGLELIKLRLAEFGLEKSITMQTIEANQKLKLGVFEIETFTLNHSIPDVVGLAIDTPQGRILYCTDWKFDHTPFDNQPSDYAKLARYGEEGVRLLMTDALGVLKPGYSPSEREIEKNIIEVFRMCKERIVFTSFASNIARMQAVINACVGSGRKLALVGRSMETNFGVAFRLGKIKVPKDLLVDISAAARLAPNQVCVLSTGNQGEDSAALSRMARDEHPLVRLQAGDSVIFSSSPIPGNEASVQDLQSNLSQKGVEIYYKPEYDIHSSGHASQKDLEFLMALTKPDYVQPIHGEHFILVRCARLAARTGVPAEHCLVGMNGRITEMRSTEVVITDEIISDKYLLVDGSGVGTVSEVVLEERRVMKTQGAIILVVLVNRKKELVSGPEIISRGFVYMKNNTVLFDELKNDIKAKLKTTQVDPNSETFYAELRQVVKQVATDVIYNKTEKMPMVIPVVVQV
jgi:ribonuclease J